MLPAELAKLTFVLPLAWQMNRQRERGLSRPSSVFQLAGHTPGHDRADCGDLRRFRYGADLCLYLCHHGLGGQG